MTKQIEQILRHNQVSTLLSISNSTLNRMVKSGLLNPPLKITARTVGYLQSEIQEFIDRRSSERSLAL